jgi:hypothetical protein
MNIAIAKGNYELLSKSYCEKLYHARCREIKITPGISGRLPNKHDKMEDD